MSKMIQINPDLFKFSSNRGTRKKKKDLEGKGEIRIKTPKEKSKTVRKNHVLRFIRDQQDKNYKKLLDNASDATKPAKDILGISNSNDSFNNDFDDSLKYLMTLTETAEKNTKLSNKNQTLKQYPNQTTQSLLYHPSIDPISMVYDNDIRLDMPNEFMTMSDTPIKPMRYPPPLSGCLKRGNLPTHRALRNQTHKNYSYVIPPVQQQIMSPFTNVSGNIQSMGGNSNINSNTNGLNNNINNDITNGFDTVGGMDNDRQKINEIKKTVQKTKDIHRHKQNQVKYKKQRRTTRRTFKLGKSKIHPKVSVLISNKTLRNNITTKTQLLKETPIQDIKRDLQKKGLIRVGSIAPNDVLRKMYESISLLCGEIQNHNPDNLLYNFFNDKG